MSDPDYEQLLIDNVGLIRSGAMLATENTRLRAALQKIADHTNCEWGPYCRDLARDALERKP